MLSVADAPLNIEDINCLPHLLQYWAQRAPDKVGFTYLVDGEDQEAHLTYAELDRRARVISERLRSLNAAGEPVLLLCPAGLDFLCGFFGILYAGAIAVPLYPPHRSRPDARLDSVMADCGSRIAITTKPVRDEILSRNEKFGHSGTFDYVTADTDDGQAPIGLHSDLPAPNEIAFLQYTSGSISEPKGVMVSQANVMANLRMIKSGFGHDANLVMVGWLPMFHDMGLVGNALQPLFLGAPLVFMSPGHFLQSPIRWLRAISRYRGTTSGGPNFAYDLCVARISPEDRASLDLSSWGTAFNGAEPVSIDTLDHFAETFSSAGFSRSAFLPCYGMAEATLLIGAGGRGARPVELHLEKHELQRDRTVIVQTASTGTSTLVGCGQIGNDEVVAIVDPLTLTECPEHQVGEIWVSSQSVAQRYWRRPVESQQTFGARLEQHVVSFLRTGDLGFCHNNELFVTGRLKDTLILHGQNYYPQDIERATEGASEAVRKGACAAFLSEIGQEKHLVIVVEIERSAVRHHDATEVTRTISKAVSERIGLRPYRVCLIWPGSIPRTSSGKIRRNECRLAFENSTLKVIESSINNRIIPSVGPIENAKREKLNA